VRYARMLESPFAFYRGSPTVMASDLAATPTTGVNVQACGDAHLLNFGCYATPGRRLTFDLNDFDETLPGPWEWDVKRLAASCAVAARSIGHGHCGEQAASASALAYAGEMTELMRLTTLEIHYAHTDVDAMAAATTNRRLASDLRSLAEVSRSHTTMQALAKLARPVDGTYQIVDRPPLIVHLDDDSHLAQQIAEVYEEYRTTLPPNRRQLLDQYRLCDFAQKVVGVGSVGTRCAIALFVGRGALDPLFLQFKQARASLLEPYVGQSEFDHSGERVVIGQQLMQAMSDIFLGWCEVGGFHFYVRQLRDMKGSVDLLRMSAPGLVRYADLCGRTLARAHARTLGPGFIAGYLGHGQVFADAIGSFAAAYADRTMADHRALVDAAAAGRIPVERRVET
jgi:uncharacterized protein (DUF2252 family)